MVYPEDDVALRYYRLERISSGAIDLDTGEMVEVKSPTDVGTGKATDEKSPMFDIVETLNVRFGTEFTEEDRLFFEQIKEKAKNNEQVQQTSQANPYDKFELGIKELIEGFMLQRMSDNDKIDTRYMDDKEFRDVVFAQLAKEIFEGVRREE